MTHPHTDRFAGSSSDSSHRASEAVLGPFTLREAVIGGSVLLIFIGSLLPFFEANDWFGNLWNASSLFFLGIGIILPVATAGLIAARRLGTDLRIGSLSVDQFASVVAALATTFFFLQTVTSFHIGPLICLIGGIGMLAATVGGPHLPMFARDFAGRPSSNAHLMARSILPAAPKKPKASEPVAAEQVTEFTPQPGSTAAQVPAQQQRASAQVTPGPHRSLPRRRRAQALPASSDSAPQRSPLRATRARAGPRRI
ncbi:hypothetical protein [Arthrobacter sp. Bz4]|uniref:hypothetical protein n=1 Tax=Arthrobacter sp. Bz4 TaxID=2171979 RepID=UPI000D514AC6|nr:hypothetical protein [Arthrobacter sp. Bz4]PVE17417.1 hypothetical protein DDA93_10505 [Arthrobacter sp. Bz4]